jgi:hypothetical protein
MASGLVVVPIRVATQAQSESVVNGLFHPCTRLPLHFRQSANVVARTQRLPEHDTDRAIFQTMTDMIVWIGLHSAILMAELADITW